MPRKDKIFSVAIKVVFIFAFGAFLAASIHHIATFYANFEPSSVDMIGSYALAIALDGTALTLTIGVMFFSKSMPTYAKVIVWIFILALTGYSWVVNFEYAARFQSSTLTSNPTLEWLNPILASSFAVLNLAYAVVSEFFNVRVKTVEELQAELTALTERASLEKQIEQYKKKNTGPGFIERTKNTAIELKKAAKEVLEDNEKEQEKEQDTEHKEDTTEHASKRDTGPLVNVETAGSSDDTERDTEPIKRHVVKRRSHKTKKVATRGNGVLLIEKELQKNPEVSNTAICKNTGLSRSYVSMTRAKLQNVLLGDYSEQKIAS